MRRAAIVSLVGSLVLAACGGGDTPSGPATPVEIQPADEAAGCDAIVRFPEGTRKHVTEGTRVQYSTLPPVSGDHEGIWGATGTYGKEIPDEIQVHNLEHGHVVIQYVPGEIDDAVLDGLVTLTKSNPEWILLAPRAANRFVPATPLAFTAWTVLRRCPAPTGKAVDAAAAFVKAYGQKAPEKIPGDPVEETPPR
ncbi:MAG TPA: DUF3105 domain-containing protein [Actinomycetota bacterium]